MNLADYEKLDTKREFNDNFIKFEATGDTKYLRFMYTSGGDEMGKDVEFRRKKWDEAQHKFVYDTEDGQLITALKCIEYDADGKNPRPVRWERSAYFCKTVLLPAWRNYPRIIDGVWKVTATNPKDKTAAYSLFPVMSADTIKFPIIETVEESKPVETKVEAPKPVEEVKPKKKYWED
nr:MAG TPA: hypothetical protein [Caudoviricetes sp.]